MKMYEITCLKCKGSNKAFITEVRPNEFEINLNADHKRNPDNIHIISARYRGDMNFGWECICGNTSILAREEFPDIKNLVINDSEQAISHITSSLTKTDNKKFKVVEL